MLQERKYDLSVEPLVEHLADAGLPVDLRSASPPPAPTRNAPAARAVALASDELGNTQGELVLVELSKFIGLFVDRHCKAINEEGCECGGELKLSKKPRGAGATVFLEATCQCCYTVLKDSTLPPRRLTYGDDSRRPVGQALSSLVTGSTHPSDSRAAIGGNNASALKPTFYKHIVNDVCTPLVATTLTDRIDSNRAALGLAAARRDSDSEAYDPAAMFDADLSDDEQGGERADVPAASASPVRASQRERRPSLQFLMSVASAEDEKEMADDEAPAALLALAVQHGMSD